MYQKILKTSVMTIPIYAIQLMKLRIYNLRSICCLGYTYIHHYFSMGLCILRNPCSEQNEYYENWTSQGRIFHLHLHGRLHGCHTSCAGEEGSVLPQKLFAVGNTGSFRSAMTETRVSFTLTNKLLTVTKNDPIISGGKKKKLLIYGEIYRWDEK